MFANNILGQTRESASLDTSQALSAQTVCNNSAQPMVLEFNNINKTTPKPADTKSSKPARTTKNKQSWVFLKGYGERLMTSEGMMIKCCVDNCGRLYKTNNGSTTSMRNHLQAIHDIEENPGHLIKKAKPLEKAPVKEDQAKVIPSFVIKPSPRPDSTPLPELSETSPIIAPVLQQAMESDLVPFHLLRDEKLSSLIQLPSSRDPQECFLPASSLQVHPDLKPHLGVYRAAVKNLLSQQVSVSLSVMRWSHSIVSETGSDSLIVTAHFITSDWVPKEAVLAILTPSQGFTGKALAQSLIEVLDDFGIASLLFTITTDNSPTLRLMVEEVGKVAASRSDMMFEPSQLHIPCLGYIINEVVNGVLKHELRAPTQELFDSTKEVVKQACFGPISAQLDKFRRGAGAIKNTPYILNHYQNFFASQNISYRELFVDQTDSWDSTFRLVDNLPLVVNAYNDACSASDLGGLCLGKEDLEFCEELKNFLGPFQALSARVSATRYLTISKAIMTYDKMLAYLATPIPQKPTYLRLCHYVALNSLQCYFGKSKPAVLYSLAMTLDPRIKWDYWKVPVYTPDDAERHRTSVLHYWNQIPHPSQTKNPTPSNSFGATNFPVSNSLSHFDTIFEDDSCTQSDELQRYLQEPVITTGFHSEKGVWEYWNRNSSQYPHLAPLARKFLTIPVFSKPCSPAQLVHLDTTLPPFSKPTSFLSEYILLSSWKKLLA